MVPYTGGNPVFRKAHFLKPTFSQHPLVLPPSPKILLFSKPTFPKLVNYTLISFKGNPSAQWKFWVHKLKPRYQETWKKAGIYDAILASTYTIQKDKNLIIRLAKKWRADTNTFVFPWGEGRELEHEAFLALWLSKFVFARGQMAAQDCHVAVHLSCGNRIALAPVVLACIYRDMRVLCNSVVMSIGLESRVGLKFITCHYDLVQMWVWERFMKLRPVPNVIERGEPRVARWNGVTNMKFIDVRAALDSSGLSFLWRPYAKVPSNSMLSDKENEKWVSIESDELESFARCLKASALVGLTSTEQYLPHRVSMQFGFDQDLPLDVVESSESPNTQSSYETPIRGVKLYIPPQLFESGVSSRYVVWWSVFLSVNQEMVNSIKNEKHFPLVISGNERDIKSSATSGCVPGFVDKRAEDGVTSAQFMIEYNMADRLGKRNDHDDDLALSSYHNVEEDSLTSAQVPNQSINRDSLEKARAVDDEIVLNTGIQGLLATCYQAPEKINCTSKPAEKGGQIISSTDKREKSIPSIGKETKPEEYADVSRNLKSTTQPAEMSVHSMSSSVKHKNSESSTEQVKPQEAVDNIINIEDERCDETASDLQHLGLEDCIWNSFCRFSKVSVLQFILLSI
ncbi:hypothetical protein POM88_025808 [Heracleum sosnowskyi]|uniref:Aminotransferase-like plant mobile domain-containing protein n=1 Tax=Heracleum sosnowskyi TaxID=360622 RepID=A0AAD8I5X7_9APIA|nr:hypothetical protein POM88_025808 [Heracleum sosnowskyi]